MSVFESLVAASQRLITYGRGKEPKSSVNPAAVIAWDLYEQVPEVGAYADWIGNAMSGATLFAGRRNPDGTIDKAPDTSRAAQLVSAMAGGPDGQSVMLSDIGVQLSVAGEYWTLIDPDPESDDYADDKWYILSTGEVKRDKTKLTAVVDGVDTDIPAFDPDNPDDSIPITFRTYRSNPRRHHLATSPVIRAITVLEELRLLNAAVAAIARSRITGRGLLLVPSEARFPTQPGQDSAEDSLFETFIEVASTAIREPESAAATVPIILEIPGDLINSAKWLQFDSSFDTLAIQLRDEAVRRFATGADIPAEVLLGLGDANHWGAWALTAEALRLGVEPKLALACQSLTEHWLQPLLDADNEPNANEWVVWYDTSGLRASSNKGANALEAFKEGLISPEAARRELGFTEDDAPAAPRPTATPDTGGNDLPVDSTQTPPQAISAAVWDSYTAGTSAALAEAVDGLVWAALIVAGRKLTQTPVVPRPARAAARPLVAAGTVHTAHPLRNGDDVRAYGLLTDAWVRVPAIASRYGVDPLRLTAALDDYVAALLLTGEPHEFDNVPRLLAQLHVGGVAA